MTCLKALRTAKVLFQTMVRSLVLASMHIGSETFQLTKANKTLDSAFKTMLLHNTLLLAGNQNILRVGLLMKYPQTNQVKSHLLLLLAKPSRMLS